MKIAILYIGTGKYFQFFEGFYRSSEKYLLKDAEKHYFVFTDQELCNYEHVTVIRRKCAGFPADSLFRFEMFLSIRDKLINYDYIYFFNANIILNDYVNENILPTEKHNYLCGLLHPVESVKKRFACFYPYERRPSSFAYIPPCSADYHYFWGALNGGRTKEYLELSERLAKNIRDDYDRGIIAIYHDESHLNKYFREHKPLVLPCEYGTPEGWQVDFEPKVIIRDKVKVDEYFRKQPPGFFAKVKQALKLLISAVRWYLHI